MRGDQQDILVTMPVTGTVKTEILSGSGEFTVVLSPKAPGSAPDPASLPMDFGSEFASLRSDIKKHTDATAQMAQKRPFLGIRTTI
jgi:hypothetical protein